MWHFTLQSALMEKVPGRELKVDLGRASDTDEQEMKKFV